MSDGDTVAKGGEAKEQPEKVSSDCKDWDSCEKAPAAGEDERYSGLKKKSPHHLLQARLRGVSRRSKGSINS